MTIEALSARPLRIAFKQAFQHSNASRDAMQSVWVEASDSSGYTGYGEGCPREYVSGESLTSALTFITERSHQWCQGITDVHSLRDWVHSHRELVDQHPAAWTAVELALLDLFAKSSQQTVEDLLQLPPLTGCFRYSAVIGDGPQDLFVAMLKRYRQAGFDDFKIKLSGDLERDRGKVAALNAAGIPSHRVRGDANNLWSGAKQALAHLKALAYPFNALEEPLKAGDYCGLAEVGAAGEWAVVLDESLLRIEQLSQLTSGTRWVINLRVSKMGGLLRSLQLLHHAREANLPIIIGAHVGETSLMTRAALVVANVAHGQLLAQEGGAGTHLLAHDIVEPPIMFANNGVLDSSELKLVPRAGFGLGHITLPPDRVGQ